MRFSVKPEAGPTQEAVARAEEAVRIADLHNHAELGYQARDDLMEIAEKTGEYDKLLVAFSWCLALRDNEAEGGESFRSMSLLWKYKWVIEHLVHYPRISLAQMASALEDFQSRCARSGFNERPALFLRWVLDVQTGALAGARQWHARWRLTQRDAMSDCEACEINRVAEFHSALDEHEAAIIAAEPILSGRLSCGEIPHLTHATLLRSFWLTNRRAEAEDSHSKGYRLVRSNRDFIREQAWHVAHLCRSNQLLPAMALIRRHLPWALETHNLDYQFHFLLATKSVVRRLVADGIPSVRLRLPAGTCSFARKTTAPTSELGDWLDERVSWLAKDFNVRNGNSWFSEMAARTDQEAA